jgi:hypothetical protein
MTIRALAFLGAVALPFLAVAEPQAGRGACEYASMDPREKKLTFCTHVVDEAHCTREAAAKGTPEWVASHPPKFTPGKTCVSLHPTAKAAKKSEQAKRASP